MRFVALISGGKDSTYNIMQCIAAGHTIVALANLEPAVKGELDSYMYQTVGHEGINFISEALGLPLYRKTTNGKAEHIHKDYIPTDNDEVEDLFELLQSIKNEIDYDAVASGAILSDYQRIRVENICSRLGLTSLSYLWRRNQTDLLNEMIECGIDAVLVKVAALGLEPSKHLGVPLSVVRSHLQRMNEKYGLHVCGEGGEYETFTLDCPLYTSTIFVDKSEIIIHSNDAIAPVGYIHFSKLHLVPKDVPSNLNERLKDIPIKTPLSYTSDIDENDDTQLSSNESDNDEPILDRLENLEENNYSWTEENNTPLVQLPNSGRTAGGWLWIGGLSGESTNPADAMDNALEKLKYCLNKAGYTIQDVCAVTLYINDMKLFANLNNVYIKTFKYANPPVRVCVQCPLHTDTPVLLDVLAYSNKKYNIRTENENSNDDGDGDSGIKTPVPPPTRITMHVQGISHWAPANIGPYSQAIQVGDIIRVAGQIGMVPGTLELIEGGVLKQCRISLRHVGRIVAALDSNMQLRDVVQGVCYVTNPNYIEIARNEWEKRTNNSIVDYLVVSQLPKGALIEWHLWAHRHNNQFEYEETGKCVDNYLFSIRRRFNYENEVAAVVCHIEKQRDNCTDQNSDSISDNTELLLNGLEYALSKLNQNYMHELQPLCNLRFFYPVNSNIDLVSLNNILNTNRIKYNIVFTIIPVSQLQTKNTLLSICGVRYE